MRIVAGDFKGRSVNPVPGDGTRPTADRVREAIASSVFSNKDEGFTGASVLDLFAGSGAVGIEALSRGAVSCTFVDSDPKSVRTIESNLASLPLSTVSTKVIKADAFTLQTKDLFGSPFDIVFLDPPYAEKWQKISQILLNMRDSGSLHPDALVVYERSAACARHKKRSAKEKKQIPGDVQEMADRLLGAFELVGVKSYGTTQVVYFKVL